jgi:hypothetical protein
MVARTLLVMSCLFLSLAAGSLWGQAETMHRSGSNSPASNIEGWQEEERDEAIQEWTWFGIGFEFRNRAMNQNHSIAVGIPLKKRSSKK